MKGPETPHRFQSLSYLNLLQVLLIVLITIVDLYFTKSVKVWMAFFVIIVFIAL